MELSLSTLPAPTHHFAGLAFGNLASEIHAGKISSPKKAALQSLERIFYLYSRGFPQIIIPPQKRPDFKFIKEQGLDLKNIKNLLADKNSRKRLSIASSSSSMWQANAATISSSLESSDKKVHFTPANLKSNLHRALELEESTAILKKVFNDSSYFTCHEAIDFEFYGGDEGAANHTRISESHSSPGLDFFVYGYSQPNKAKTGSRPRRQSLESQKQIIINHKLNPERIIFAKQNPEAIEAGVFHNDVISTGNENFFLYHELAFEDTEKTLDEINEKYLKLNPTKPLILIKISESELSLAEAVSSYLFNSQILSKPDGSMLLLAPEESRLNQRSNAVIERVLNSQENPISEVKFIDLKESMSNGGGPACLRLRVPLHEEAFKAINPRYIFNEKTYQVLKDCINEYYRDSLILDEIYTEKFLEETEKIYRNFENIFAS
jgi:succinylarginine dihydrolase